MSMKEKLKAWALARPWVMKLPMMWRLKYEFYHEQFVPPVKVEVHKKDLNHIHYEGITGDWDLISNTYSIPEFRCPHCGQAHELRFAYRGEDCRIHQNETLTVVWIARYEKNQLIEQLKPGTYEYNCVSGILGDMMPIPCHLCRETYPKWMWADAYMRPELYFEEEALCHCGGEMLWQGSPGTTRMHVVCEKCGWVDPRQTIDGAAKVE
jgi:predicted RNA-binding Zn-ribbon protein involved in translation (DUF1610 family)